MTKTKYLLYAFKCKHNQKYSYWYETDFRFFQEKKPPLNILKKGDNYISRIHAGYKCDYEPMKELLKMKILEEVMSE